MNTVDVVGDEALTTSIIDRSITEIADNLVTRLGTYAFSGCSQLTTADFSVATSVGDYAFSGCSALTAVDFPAVTRIESGVFNYCSKLTALILRSARMATLTNANVCNSTPIKSGTGYIYVPRALLSDTDSTKDYRQASNWSTYAAQFRALEDYTVDGTTTGALDETKI